MSTDQLRRELSELVNDVPAPAVARDTWQRARRSLVRDRIAGVLAVAAVLAGVALTGMPWLRSSPEEGGFALPATLSAAGDEDLPVETDLAIGTAAAAYPLQAADGGLRIVVATAADDVHHALQLPELPTADNHSAWVPGHWNSLRLSPDGRQLAYITASGAGTEGATGVSVLDLRTGEVRDTQLPEPIGAVTLTWSPEGRYLAWSGSRIEGTELTGRLAGLIGPDGASTALPKATATGELAPGDDGTVAVLGANGPVRLWKPGHVDRLDGGPTGSVLSAELAGGVVSEVRSTFTATDDDLVHHLMFVRHGTHLESGALPADLDRAYVFGWTAHGAALAVDPFDEQFGPTPVRRLTLDHGKVTAEAVMTLDVRSLAVTLATALPIDGAPEDEPRQLVWPWLVGGGALLLLAAAVLAARVRSALRLRRALRLA